VPGEDHDPLPGVRPLGEAQHLAVRVAADQERVDAGQERLVAVLAAVERLEPVERAVLAGDEAVEGLGDVEHHVAHAAHLLTLDVPEPGPRVLIDGRADSRDNHPRLIPAPPKDMK